MSLSRSGKNLLQLLTIQTKPSPTYQTCIPDFAQDSESSVDGGTIHRFISDRFTEGTSLFTSLCRKVRAGMTVEATIVLPLFLLFILSMGSALEMIRLHGNLQLGLWDVGRKLSLYAYGAETAGITADDGEEAGALQQVAEVIFASAYVKAQIIETVGETYLEESPIVGGSDGLLLVESEVLTEDDRIELYVTYSVQPFGGLLGNIHFRMANKYCGHIWNGYEIPGTEGVSQAGAAYLAENAAVYHLDRKCTHLQLSVRCIFSEDIAQVKNSYGRRYEECKKCVVPADEAWKSICYIADDGDCYHWNVDCSGLKRTVRWVSIEEAKQYAPCSRCAVE